MLYQALLNTHSVLRYVVLILIVIVTIKSLTGWLNKRPYSSLDNKLGMWMVIAVHTQLLTGLILYFVSPFVQFNDSTMKDSVIRYWTVEHITAMIFVVVLITIARSSSKKLSADVAKHRRMFILTTIALLLIVGAISMSGRGILIPAH
jgi:hypothetical protein